MAGNAQPGEMEQSGKGLKARLRSRAAPLAFAGGAYAGLYIFMVFWMGLPALPPPVGMPLGVMAATLVPVVATALTASRNARARYALIAFAVAEILSVAAWYFAGVPARAVIVAGAGTAAVTLVFALQRRRAGAAAGALFAALLAASYLDWPASPDPLPIFLEAAARTKPAIAVRTYVYPLGGFIDTESLWRLEAPVKDLEAIGQRLGMQPVQSVPGTFWRMPPIYWPRRLPPGAGLFATPKFPDKGRGPDGDHYFMLIDPQRRRALVWAKNNF